MSQNTITLPIEPDAFIDNNQKDKSGLFKVLTKDLEKVTNADMMLQISLNLAGVGPRVEYCDVLDDEASGQPGDPGIIPYLK